MRKKKIEEVKEPVIENEVKEEPVKEVKEEYYFARIGESLEDIAKKFGISADKLKELNGDIIGGNQTKLK